MIVIPIAGVSRRFKIAGVSQPKWSLRIGNQSVLEMATRSILNSLQNKEILLYIVRDSEIKFLSKIVEEIKDQRIQVVQISSPTSGQAETIFEGLYSCKYVEQERLIIWCGDSAYRAESFDFSSISGNWIAVSKLKGEHWSFVEVNAGSVIRTTEKIKISDFASIGLYGFSSIREFMSLDPTRKDVAYSEAFVAPLFNRLIAHHTVVKAKEISGDDYYPMGTPEEIKETCLRLGLDIPAVLKGPEFNSNLK